MALIQVTAAQIRIQAQQLGDLNQKYHIQVAHLDDEELSLKNMWEGEANRTFHKSFVDDTKQMDQFYQATIQYVTALEVIARKYEEAERRNTETAAKKRR